MRRGHNGAERLVGGGLVGAAFRHRTSRAGDPQLHTHVVVANAAQGPDGRWSALDARHLYGQARTAGFLYQAELRAGLSARLDAGWERTVKGTGDLTAVPVEVRREFSRRRAQIEAALGPDATPARRVRRRCGPDPPRPRTLMRGRCTTTGSTARERSASRPRCCTPNLAREADMLGGLFDPSRVSVTEVCAELTEHRSTFDRRHVLQALAGHAHDRRDRRRARGRKPTGCSPGPGSCRSGSAGSGSATRPRSCSRSKPGSSTKPRARGDEERGVVPDPEVDPVRAPGTVRRAARDGRDAHHRRRPDRGRGRRGRVRARPTPSPRHATPGTTPGTRSSAARSPPGPPASSKTTARSPRSPSTGS